MSASIDSVAVSASALRRSAACARSRSSAAIIDQQTAGLKAAKADTLGAMHKLKADAAEMKRALLIGDIDGMARILNESWKAKKATA